MHVHIYMQMTYLNHPCRHQVETPQPNPSRHFSSLIPGSETMWHSLQWNRFLSKTLYPRSDNPIEQNGLFGHTKGLVTNYGEGGYKMGGGASEVLALYKGRGVGGSFYVVA